MKNLFLIFLFSVLSFESYSQEFLLTDSTFEVGAVYRPFDNILYLYNSDSILERSYPVLDSIAQFLIDHPTIEMEIGVHSDGRGSKYYCRNLGAARAKSVIIYLNSKGIAVASLTGKNYRGEQPIIPVEEIEKMKTAEEKEAAYQTNRRTEFKIIKR